MSNITQPEFRKTPCTDHRHEGEIVRRWGKFSDQEIADLKDKDDLVGRVQVKYQLERSKAQRDVDAFAKGRQLWSCVAASWSPSAIAGAADELEVSGYPVICSTRHHLVVICDAGYFDFTSLDPSSTTFSTAPIGADDGEMPLSVLSALTRLDLDPWQEAAELSELPKGTATQRLAALIARLPGRTLDTGGFEGDG